MTYDDDDSLRMNMIPYSTTSLCMTQNTEHEKENIDTSTHSI